MTYSINLNTGVVTLDSNGVQVAPAQSITDPNYVDYMAWIAAGNTPTVLIEPAAPVSMQITVLGFRNRFTQSEKIAMEMASIDNPAATMQQRQLAASLRVLQADIAVAKFIDLARPDTITGVQALEQYGIIAAGRANSILTTPITPSETPTL